MLFSGVKKTAVGATAALAAAGALALSATAVSAVPIHPQGTHGQRVHLCLPQGFRGGSADIRGTNNYNDPNARMDGIALGQGCTAVSRDADWWWVGSTTITWRVWDGPNKTTRCDVPSYQSGGDDFFCEY